MSFDVEPSVDWMLGGEKLRAECDYLKAENAQLRERLRLAEAVCEAYSDGYLCKAFGDAFGAWRAACGRGE